MNAPEENAAITQSDQINALRHEFPDDGGWLSTLVWNVRNEYVMWPEGRIDARAVRLIVEGFLAELDDVRGAVGGVLPDLEETQ